MATNLIMPRLPDPHQHAGFFAQPITTTAPLATPYQPPPPTNFTPQISPLSTSGNANGNGNGSPTSPKSHITRPIRPMYMPAVLRPTEFHSKAPPQHVEGDVEEESERERFLRTNASFISISGLSALSRLSRRSTGDSGKCVDGDWNLDLFPKPTGQPTRKHWKADSESTVCDHATCKRSFTYFTRRHHCRKCGNIFCDAHSAFEIPLDQDANYNPRGTPSRSCAHCHSMFKEWRSRTNSQSSTASGGDGAKPMSPGGVPMSPIGVPGTPHVPDAAASVPTDWNWSTF